MTFSPSLSPPSAYADVRADLQAHPRRWLVTGAAGFIGSNLLEALLDLNQTVVGLDNFATGHRRNLDEIEQRVGPARWRRFTLVEGDIRDPATCRQACAGADAVLHQAALGSVPGSIADPATSQAVNVGGFVNLLVAARDAGVARFVYAASCATYGDSAGLPKVEDEIGRPLSPYALTKYINELYAEVFHRTYGFESVGLRYFNVFGRRQDPHGAYAAVIPQWTAALIRGEAVFINGDGETTRDFCYVEDVVQANLLAAATAPGVGCPVLNVAGGVRTSLNELYGALGAALAGHGHGGTPASEPVYRDFRPGDIQHSHASIERANRLLGFAPAYSLTAGLALAMPWYLATLGSG